MMKTDRGTHTDERFSKYETLGDYHHREYAANTIYAAHARRVRNWITEHRVLDVGCGDGLITCLLRDKGHDVEGIDPNARVTDTLYIATPLRGAQPADDYHAHEFLPGELRKFMAALGWEHLSSEYLNFRILAKFRRRAGPWWRIWR